MKYTTKLTIRQIEIVFGWMAFITLLNWLTQDSFLLAVVIGSIGTVVSVGSIPLIERLK